MKAGIQGQYSIPTGVPLGHALRSQPHRSHDSQAGHEFDPPSGEGPSVLDELPLLLEAACELLLPVEAPTDVDAPSKPGELPLRLEVACETALLLVAPTDVGPLPRLGELPVLLTALSTCKVPE